MKKYEYDGGAVYYVQDFAQLTFPLSRSGSSLPTSLIHRIRDKTVVVETTYTQSTIPQSPEHVDRAKEPAPEK